MLQEEDRESSVELTFATEKWQSVTSQKKKIEEKRNSTHPSSQQEKRETIC
jgi:uncharacterized Zn finger protein (UPF0148 family)